MLKMQVPVLDSNMQPLTPCHPGKARRLLKEGKASAYWSKGVFCIILHRPVEPTNKEPVVLAVDPGSKFTGITVLSGGKVVINIMIEAITHVKDAVEARRNARRARRHRNCRRREARFKNRLRGKKFLPPSTRARWGQIIRLLNQFQKILPITDVVIEDIKASTKKGARKWNKNFSPLEVGKTWCYQQIRDKGLKLHLKQGFETAELRKQYGLKKTSSKSKKAFEAHCVDSWVMAASVVGAREPDDRSIWYWVPIRVFRRQLHVFQPSIGGYSKPRGGTRSMGLCRGTLAIHPKHGLVHIGGASKGRISLHARRTGKRLTQGAKITDVTILTRTTYRVQFLP
jgi:hypothetical protein